MRTFQSLLAGRRIDRFDSSEQRLVVIGEAGHINTAAGYGRWEDGERMLLDVARSPG
jgi:predicted alpha/beta hydrolase family esterase